MSRYSLDMSRMIKEMVAAIHANPPVTRTAKQWADSFGIPPYYMQMAVRRAPAIAKAIKPGFEEAALESTIPVIHTEKGPMVQLRKRVLLACGLEHCDEVAYQIDRAKQQIIIRIHPIKKVTQ